MNVTPNASILVVEDNPDLNLAICEILESFGYQVRSAQNGFEALDLLSDHRPDVILCDIMMPGMDGYTLLQRTRADVNLRLLPFIFLTARTSTADQRRAREIGIDDYLTKPIDSNDLVVAIENALLRYKNIQEAAQRRLDELRNNIVGILQHEFRTPLTFVLGYAELLASPDLEQLNIDELRMAANAILDGGRRLHQLIEGFLLLAELQNRTLNPQELGPINGWTLCHNVMHDMAGQAKAVGMSIELSTLNRTVPLLGDGYLINECLRRLVDNAIRYRRPDSQLILLSVELLPAYVGLRVHDDGVGIPPDRLAEFAQPFAQPDRENRTTPGAGLSLALIRHVANLHSGSLEISSDYGKGSTFTLWLPAYAAPA